MISSLRHQAPDGSHAAEQERFGSYFAAAGIPCGVGYSDLM
jgi:hypothetical protein